MRIRDLEIDNYLRQIKAAKAKKEVEEEKEDIYCEEGLGNFADDDEISAAEEGFMLGYINA
jgi:hypothetical protein